MLIATLNPCRMLNFLAFPSSFAKLMEGVKTQSETANNDAHTKAMTFTCVDSLAIPPTMLVKPNTK